MVNPIANQPLPQAKKLKDLKVADPQYLLSSDPITSPEEMENNILQGIGGHEILSIVRRDLVDGTNKNYGIISNLEKLFFEYNPKTINALSETSSYYFSPFAIKFEKHTPSNIDNPVIWDSESQQVSIFVANPGLYEVQIQSLTAAEILRDTIYEENES